MLGIAVIVATAVGCGSAQPTATRSVPASIISVVFRDRGYVLQGNELTRAEAELTRRCMQRKGLPYDGDQPALPPAPSLTLPAAGAGYGLAALVTVDDAVLDRLRDRSSDPVVRYVQSLPADKQTAYLRALSGTPRKRATLPSTRTTSMVSYPTDGCSVSAIASLYGNARVYYTQNARQNTVSAAVLATLKRDRRLAGSVAAWSRCMRRHHLRYPSPTAARDATYSAYLTSADRDRARQRELATAAADRACGIATAIYREQDRAQRDAIAALPPTYVRWMTALARSRAEAVRRAHAIVSR